MRKRISMIVAIVFLIAIASTACLYAGSAVGDFIEKITHSALATDQVAWKIDAEGITVAQAAMAVTERVPGSINALPGVRTTVCDLDARFNTVWFRFRTDGVENSTNVFEVYAANGPSEHFSHVGQITITEGTQFYATGVYFCDTFAWTAGYPVYSSTFQEIEPTNSIGYLVVDRQVFTRWVFIASTLSNTTVYVDYCGM